MSRLTTIFICLMLSIVTFAKSPKIRIGMITDVGGINDQSFNQSAWEGLKKVKKDLDIQVSYLESKQDADYASHLETLLDSQNDLIWGIGFKMSDVVLKAALRNPKQKYAIIDFSYPQTPSNLVGVVFKSEESAFLVGYIAGKMTQSQTIGFVGGMNVPVIQAFQYGFKAGALYANPKIKILEQMAESFTDAAKGKAIANKMIQQGADILFHAAGSVGDGVIEAAKEKNIKAIGVDRDQNAMAPKNVITSAMKRIDNAIYKISQDLKNNQYQGGKTVTYGLKDGGVDIAPTTAQNVPAPILKEVDAIRTKIINNQIIPPANKEKFDLYIKTKK